MQAAAYAAPHARLQTGSLSLKAVKATGYRADHFTDKVVFYVTGACSDLRPRLARTFLRVAGTRRTKPRYLGCISTQLSGPSQPLEPLGIGPAHECNRAWHFLLAHLRTSLHGDYTSRAHIQLLTLQLLTLRVSRKPDIEGRNPYSLMLQAEERSILLYSPEAKKGCATLPHYATVYRTLCRQPKKQR